MDARDTEEALAPPAVRGGVGVIAGAGVLPRLIAEALAAERAPYMVLGFEGVAPGWLDGHPHRIVPFEKIGAIFEALRAAGASRVVFAGGMTRPKINPLRFDRTAARLAATLLPLLRQGDDALLAGLARAVEQEGFEMVGAHALLGGLLAPAGAFSVRAPGEDDLADIARAAELAALIGAADVGQAAIVDRGLCVGLETLQGTDAMLDFAARRPEALRAPGGAPSGVLYKGPKPGQDWRVDLPAIGPDTVRAAAAAGLAGLAVRAGGVLVLGLAETRAEADRLGLFLHGWTPPAETSAPPVR